MVNKRETIYFIISVSDKRLSSFLYFFNFIPFLLLMSSFFPTFFVLILSYLSGTCTFFFANISGRNFLASFGYFWAEFFSRWGGGWTCTQYTPTPPVYAPVYLCVYGIRLKFTVIKGSYRFYRQGLFFQLKINKWNGGGGGGSGTKKGIYAVSKR